MPGKALAGFAVFLCLFTLALMGAGWWYLQNMSTPLTAPMTRLKSALEAITHNEVRQDGYSLEIQTNNIQELATVEREFQSIVKYEAYFLGQKKLLILKGNFRAKAGFDLARATDFSISNERVVGDLPRAEILSVEMLTYEVFHAEDNIFNQLKPADQEAATRHLLEQARRDAQQSDLRMQAETRFQQRLGDLMHNP